MTATVKTHKASGFIAWPEHLQSSGEGGTWVMAVVPDDMTFNDYEYQEKDERPFERCHMDTLPCLPQPNALQDPDPHAGDPYVRCPRCLSDSPWEFETAPFNECPVCKAQLTDDEAKEAHRQIFPLQEKHWPWANDKDPTMVDFTKHSRAFLACVCLGSSNITWVSDGYERFIATKDDLTSDGVELVEKLEQLYGRPVELLTLIDT
jgi:hypothetical protein